MKIAHIALWVSDLQQMRDFYQRYFSADCNDKYTNTTTQFSSYFLTFDDDCRLEIMQRPDVSARVDETYLGYTHLAVSVGSRENVDDLTERLRADGFVIASEARTTGDGYYESVVLDPEGNRLEITS